MLQYKTGNLFDNLPTPEEKRYIVIPHVCNDIYVMGSGFVVPLCNKWPQVREEYVRDKPKLGTVHPVGVQENIVVANMIAQHETIRDNIKPIRYAALCKCMSDIRKTIKYTDITHDTNTEIYAPLFGSGLAGGNWDFIEELIQEIWCDIDVTIWQLPGQELR